MRLLTHNFLKCNEAKCTGGYPLIIKLNEDVEGNVNIIEQEMNPEFIKNVLSKVDYEVLYNTAKQFGVSLLSSYNNNHLEDEGFLNSVHHALFKIHIMEGSLTCPKCNISFPIKDGIPNMLAASEE
ncbi:multifunctional methyltransferase subunit TRM112, putative [Plasmodium chabaudi chabaudi]|uniref:Multifunctional methyltransferase subunit TRM112, putative n=2 Tax=Plasmodium chabaudi TaxID=5825 RepID=A0A077YET2_PLACU|nr:multifunctional methyltransferase subunit TRM112, putative [Plasmodium chabaudi chabaudi]SCM08308.1 multifunctional methyltransferase subunit TRM112, putative [Plasmodium chabaudi adami]SCM03007.1 multifunctional methyltransferase subunit TRM112, putative [Plasmodium chabaudi chabaudi]SCM05709.1 multifunctional methyltransferase subunit TRM112, putative [Plasmodium chabaudi chabaudi]SCM11310.1 multifunctional methyltransferase subunit TRM112, putative [Plasmodium chabaudi adami]VTZ66691.1 m|eukprot:XP_016655659.1 nucleolar preribosomal GTPase, putative [Plasmodium chabaudi chabaudi]